MESRYINTFWIIISTPEPSPDKLMIISNLVFIIVVIIKVFESDIDSKKELSFCHKLEFVNPYIFAT